MYDPSSAKLATLDAETRNRAEWMLWAVRTAGIPLIITSARRSLSEQQQLVELGRSRTMQSKHLLGRAFDVDISGVSRDQVPKWFWNILGPWAERELGLIWGGRWTSIWDPGHFELP